jgi:ABC-type transporter Mla subunit MlaD
MIPRSHVESTQQLDQVLSAFGRPTQRDLEAFLSGSAAALAGRGQDLNDALGNLDPTLTQLQAIFGVLDGERGDFQRLVRNSATVVSTLGARSGDLQSLVTAGDQVFSATTARDAALSATIDAMPPFLSRLRATLGTVNVTLADAKPTLDAFRPAAPLLAPALSETIALSGPTIALLHEAPSLLDASAKALPAATRFTRAFRPAMDALLPAVREVVPVISFIGLYHRELVTAMANLAADLEATAPASTNTGTAHYLRSMSGLGNESIFGQSVREPTSRANAYFAPGELAYVGRGGLLSASCANTQNASQSPFGFANVPCRVQPGFRWSGITRYFPHVTRGSK